MCIEYIANKKDLTDIIISFAIPVIGFLGVYIAWSQWITASYRYKLDLFDKRFVVYESVIDFIMSVRGGGKVSDTELSIFKEKTLPVRFLFSDEVAEHIAKIRDKAIDTQTYAAEVENMPPSDEKIEILRQSSEAKKWLYKQINEKELNSKFGEFMKITPNPTWYQRIKRYIKKQREHVN